MTGTDGRWLVEDERSVAQVAVSKKRYLSHAFSL